MWRRRAKAGKRRYPDDYTLGWVIRPYMYDPDLVDDLRINPFSPKSEDRSLFVSGGNRWLSVRALNAQCDFSRMLAFRYRLLRENDIGNGLDDYFASTERLDLEHPGQPIETQREICKDLDVIVRPLAKAIHDIQMIDLGGHVARMKLDTLGYGQDVVKLMMDHLDPDWIAKDCQAKESRRRQVR